MPDFTINTFRRLLTTLKGQKYTFQTFAEFLKDPAPRIIILRHDVDARKINSLTTALLEKELGITGTYYYRMVPGSFNEDVIKQIAGLGHEIGYHYEDINMAVALRRASCVVNQIMRRKTQNSRLTEEELPDAAIASFRENLAKLRRVVPVETICMHGSPLSRFDNRSLWKKYNYRDFGIIGEPYFDINFEEVLYLTDTGRRWDADSVNIRDKATGGRALKNDPVDHFSDGARLQGRESNTEKRHDVWGMGYEVNHSQQNENRTPRASSREPVFRFHSTFDIIRAAESGILPDKIMITVHPQRWDNKPFPWVEELVWQNVKNIGKRIVVFRQRLKLNSECLIMR